MAAATIAGKMTSLTPNVLLDTGYHRLTLSKTILKE